MKSGSWITVVHDGETVRAYAFQYSDKSWRWIAFASGDNRGGILHRSDEGVHWIRGFLFRWWPPHRKQIAALCVASALAGPHPELPLIVSHVQAMHLAQQTYEAVIAKIGIDTQKLMQDAIHARLSVLSPRRRNR